MVQHNSTEVASMIRIVFMPGGDIGCAFATKTNNKMNDNIANSFFIFVYQLTKVK
jgi:hypothetical protein